MGMVLTSKGLIERDRLVVKDIITEEENSRAIATEWFLDGELVKRDATVTIFSGLAMLGEQSPLN